MRGSAVDLVVVDAVMAADLGSRRLDDVLGEVPRSYPVGFYAEPEDEDVEREALDEEIYTGLVLV